MARAGRGPRARDMVLSLLVILVPLVIITVLLTRGAEQPEVETVRWRPIAEQAAREAPYEVLAPVELPVGWRATRTSWTPKGQPAPTGEMSVRNRWRLGVITDQGIYIELNQGDEQPDELVEQVTRKGIADGAGAVEGSEWQRMVSPDDRTRSLMLATPRVTTVVTGDTSYEQLQAYVGLLAPVG